MIHEFRTYWVRAGKLDDVIQRFGEGYDTRKDIKPITAFWYTEIGELNQIIQVWSWEDMAERDQVRVVVNKLPTWPPGLGPTVIHQSVEIFNPLPGFDTLQPGDHGPIYEMRTAELPPGSIRGVREAVEKSPDARNKISPVAAALATDMGTLNHFVHISAYEGLQAMQDANDKIAADGGWPVLGDDVGPVFHTSKVMRASSFSPMQ